MSLAVCPLVITFLSSRGLTTPPGPAPLLLLWLLLREALHDLLLEVLEDLRVVLLDVSGSLGDTRPGEGGRQGGRGGSRVGGREGGREGREGREGGKEGRGGRRVGKREGRERKEGRDNTR